MPSLPASETSRIIRLGRQWNLTSRQVILATILIAIASVCYGGWVLSVLWGWFLTPFGLPHINFVWGVGMHCIGVLLTFRRGPADIIYDDAMAAGDLRRLGTVLAAIDYTFLLLIGCAANAFM